MKNPVIAAMLDTVQIEEDKDHGGFTISPVWKNVDRPIVYGISVPVHDAALVPKIDQAMRDGAYWSHAEVKTDTAGNTYVQSSERVIGKYLEANLREIGYL